MGQGRKSPAHLRVEHLRRQFSKRNRTRHPREFLGRDCFPSFEGSNVDSNGPSSAHSPTSSNVIIIILRVFDDNERGADRHLVLRRDMSLREAKSMIAAEASIPLKYLFLCIQLPDRAVELRRDDASLGDLGIPNNATLMATSMASEGTTMAAVTTDEECEQTSSNESVDPVNLSPEHRSTDQSDASQGGSSAGDKSGGVKGDDSISSRRDDLFQVFVRTPYGNTTTLSVNQSTTVADLKRQLSSSTTITPSNGMRLCYGGKPLSDTLTLAEYGITRDSTLEMHDGGLMGGSWGESECPGSPGIDELVAEISRRGAEISRRDAEISRQEAVISRQEAVIYRQEGEISRQDAEITRREEENNVLRGRLDRRLAKIRNLGVALAESEESRRELEERSSSDTRDIAILQERVVAQQEELVSSRNFLSTFSRDFRELRESNSSLTANAATLRHTVDYQQGLLSSLGEVRSENDGLLANLDNARETIDAHRLQIAEMEGVIAASQDTISTLRSDITTLQQQVEVAVGQVTKLNGDNTHIHECYRGLQLSLTQSQQNLQIVTESNERYEQENANLQESLRSSREENAEQQALFHEFANQATSEAEHLRAENALLREQLAEQAANVTLSVADVTLREQLDEANVSLAQRDQTIVDREAEIQQLREQIQQYETMAQSRDRVDSTSVTPAPSRRGDGGDSSLAPSLPSSDSANDADSDPPSPSASDTASSSPVGETSSESPSLPLDESDMDDSNDNDERNPGVAVNLADLNCEERAEGLEQAYRDGLLGDQGEAGATSEGSVADDDGHGVASSNHNLALGRAAPSSAKSKVDTSVKSKVEPSLQSKKSQTAPAELSEESLPSQSKKEAAKAPSKSNVESSLQPRKKTKKAQTRPANQSSLKSFFSSKSSADSLPKSKAASGATSHRSKRKATMAESRNSSDSNDASNLDPDKKRRSNSAIPKQSESQPLAKALVSESSTKTSQPKRKAITSETCDSSDSESSDDNYTLTKKRSTYSTRSKLNQPIKSVANQSNATTLDLDSDSSSNSDSDFEDDDSMIQSKKTKGGTRSTKGAQAKTNSSTKQPAKKVLAKQVTPVVMTSCVEAVSDYLSEVSHFKVMQIDGTTVRLKPEYIISIPSEDGLSPCEYRLNEEKLRNDGVTFPDHSLISNIEPIYPNEKYLRVNFPSGKNVTPESERLLAHLQTVVLKPLVGPKTEFKKNDAQIKKFCIDVVMPKVRKRKELFSMANIAVKNLAGPGRGFNSMVQDFEDVVGPSLLGLIQDGVVPESLRPTSLEAHSFMIDAVSQVSCFDREDAQIIVNSTLEDYVSLCMNSVERDSLDQSDALAIQDAQNNRGESGLALKVYVIGASIAARQGAAVPVTYTDGTKGLIVALPSVGETFQKPTCIGGLKKKYLRRTWGKNDFEVDGTCTRITFRTQYFYDLCTCRMLMVYTKEELDKMTKTPHNYIRNTIVPLNDDYFLAFLAEPSAKPGGDGLTTFQYTLNIEPRVEGGDNRQCFQAHQLTEMAKRQINADTRGSVMDWASAKLGFPNQTPEQFLPIVGRGRGSDKEAVLPFIPPEEENEIGDVEHSLGRDELTDNRGEVTRGANHSRNVRIVTTQSLEKTERNGTGDHNFCHVHVAWKANSHSSS